MASLHPFRFGHCRFIFELLGHLRGYCGHVNWDLRNPRFNGSFCTMVTINDHELAISNICRFNGWKCSVAPLRAHR